MADPWPIVYYSSRISFSIRLQCTLASQMPWMSMEVFFFCCCLLVCFLIRPGNRLKTRVGRNYFYFTHVPIVSQMSCVFLEKKQHEHFSAS